MKARHTIAAMLLALGFVSCDDTTDTIGASLTDRMDYLQITTDTFVVSTRSIMADSVLARTSTGYLGQIKDPETGAYITGDFMMQFHNFENFQFPDPDEMLSKEDGEVVADSCDIRLFYNQFYGDSLSTMKVTVHEMGKPMEEGVKYYSNFDPLANGYVRSDGIHQSKVYTLTDHNVSDSLRALSDYVASIRIPLNAPYTDQQGNTYKNYGTYVMQSYYKNPEVMKNSYNFIHDVCPGFYIKTEDGLGSMAYIYLSWLNIYFKVKSDTTVYVASSSFAGTEEVLQTTRITNDKQTLEKLAADNTCTYIKSPAGIFTEMTLPVDDITRGHENDTLNTAKVTLHRINNDSHSPYILNTPQQLLMIERDSIYTFFEKQDIVDNQQSFLTSISSNSYTFSNISNMVRHMAEARRNGLANNPNWETEHPNWNKVVLIPVSTETTASGSTYSKISHDMSLTSTRLVGGSQNPNGDITISVIYSKFSDK